MYREDIEEACTERTGRGGRHAQRGSCGEGVFLQREN